jgi:hypothetical protein
MSEWLPRTMRAESEREVTSTEPADRPDGSVCAWPVAVD